MGVEHRVGSTGIKDTTWTTPAINHLGGSGGEQIPRVIRANLGLAVLVVDVLGLHLGLLVIVMVVIHSLLLRLLVMVLLVLLRLLWLILLVVNHLAGVPFLLVVGLLHLLFLLGRQIMGLLVVILVFPGVMMPLMLAVFHMGNIGQTDDCHEAKNQDQ